MRLTQVHIDFWLERKMPGWAQRVDRPRPRVDIDSVVNSHAGGMRIDTDIHNTLVLLRSYRRRGVRLSEMLAEFAQRSSGKRQRLARKWLKRMEARP